MMNLVKDNLGYFSPDFSTSRTLMGGHRTNRNRLYFKAAFIEKFELIFGKKWKESKKQHQKSARAKVLKVNAVYSVNTVPVSILAPKVLNAQTYALDVKNMIHGAQAKNL